MLAISLTLLMNLLSPNQYDHECMFKVNIRMNVWDEYQNECLG